MIKKIVVMGIIVTTLMTVIVSNVSAIPPVKTVETKDGRLLLNGQLFLPIAIYHAAHDHKGLPEAGEKGFNTVQVHGRTPAALKKDLDNAFANGMYGLVALNGLCEDLDFLKKLVLANRNHPGLLVWSLEDEPNGRVSEPNNIPFVDRAYRLPPEKLKLAYDLIKKLDPKHPIWLNLCHGILKDHQVYEPVADIMSDDIYPIPKNALACVAAYADVTVQGCAGKPAWLVLQMNPVRPDWKEKDRHPTIAEVRCMTYMAIAHDVSGVLYYAFNEANWEYEGWPWSNWRTSRSAPAYWAQWTDLTAELNALAPLILSPSVKGDVEVEILKGNAGIGPWDFSALHLSLRKGRNSYFMIAVNGFNTPIKAKFSLPAEVKNIAENAAVRFENRLLKIRENVLLDNFEPYAVHLYEIPFGKVYRK